MFDNGNYKAYNGIIPGLGKENGMTSTSVSVVHPDDLGLALRHVAPGWSLLVEGCGTRHVAGQQCPIQKGLAAKAHYHHLRVSSMHETREDALVADLLIEILG